jgi:leucyl-tRNA---protein transferase
MTTLNCRVRLRSNRRDIVVNGGVDVACPTLVLREAFCHSAVVRSVRYFLSERPRRMTCLYLPRRNAAYETRMLLTTSLDEVDALLEHGWRRSGNLYLQQTCSECHECVSLRIPVPLFTATRAQRRSLRKCADLRLEVGLPQTDDERVAVYRSWLQMQVRRRGWEECATSTAEYEEKFCAPHRSAREMLYYDGERLVAVGIVDVTPKSFSSVDFFYDPESSTRSLGVASVLRELDMALELGCQYLYLGYRVKQCSALSYKEQFRPHELLSGRPELDEDPRWVPAG